MRNSSDLSFDSSEVSFRFYVESISRLRGDQKTNTWRMKNIHGGIVFSSVEWIYRFVRGSIMRSCASRQGRS